jgi:putative DNA primase/helicase
MSLEIIAAAKEALKLSFSCFPAYQADSKAKAKAPTIEEWKPYQSERLKTILTDTLFSGDKALALIGGPISGNLECLDFDNPHLFRPYMVKLRTDHPQLAGKLLAQQTPSGGFHLLYRCTDQVTGSRLVAAFVQEVSGSGKHDEPWEGGKEKHLLAKETGGKWTIQATAIETRGAGGYFLVAPSRGYSFLNGGSLEFCPTITGEEREALLSLARSYDQRPKGKEKRTAPAQTQAPAQPITNQAQAITPGAGDHQPGYGRPGDFYNADWQRKTPALLEVHGWQRTGKKEGDNEHWTRPGKEPAAGTSGTLRHTDGVFYCFSSNADPLEPGESYDPFGLFALLDHGGDIAAATKAAAQHLPEVRITKQIEPIPLPSELLPVEPFDFALLPYSLQPWAQDICERMQCPPDFVGVAIMVSLSAVIGRKIGIRPQQKTDWTVTPNLWGLVVGRPGTMKSPSLEAAMAPLNRLVAEANKVFAENDEEYQKELVIVNMRNEANKRAAVKKLSKSSDADISDLLSCNMPEAPILQRYKTNDSTPASLGELLRQNQNGILVYRDEIVSLLKGLDKEDQAEGRGFYLTGWNGDSPYTLDRMGRGFNLHIDAVCLSLLGGTQPGRLSEYVRQAVKGGIADDGLMQRFGLTVWPDNGPPFKNVDRYPDTDKKNEAFKVFDYLDKIDLEAIGAQQDKDFNGEYEGIPYLRFDNDAHELFLEWRIALENSLRGDELTPALESHFSKYKKIVPAMALIIHLATGSTGPVDKVATLQALAWGGYLESHARRIYGAGTQPAVATAKAILAKIKTGALPATGFSSKDVWRPQWSKLSDSQQVNEGLQLLVDYYWLVEERIDTGGRPSTVYHFAG